MEGRRTARPKRSAQLGLGVWRGVPIARVSRNPSPEALFVRIIIWATQKRAISWPRNHTRVFFGIVPFDSSRLLSFFMGWSACCPLLCVLNQRRHDYCSKAICSYVLGRRRLCAYVCVYCLPFRRLREKGPLPLSAARRFSPQRLFFVCSICIPCESQKKISPRPAIPRESKEMR